MEAFQCLEVLPSSERISFQQMEVENFYVLISEKITSLNFALDANYNVAKVKNQFQLSVYCNRRFCGIEADFSKIEQHCD